MSKAVVIPTEATWRETDSEITRRQTADSEKRREPDSDQEPRLRSPQHFYAEVTKRPDVREILKKLAES